VRDAVMRDDRKKMAELAGRKQVAEQPPGFVAFLGESGAISVERRRELLTVAVRHRPADLHLLMTLGFTYALDEKDTADERVRWFQAAVGVAPRNSGFPLIALGLALKQRGELDEAIACYNKAIEIDPKDVIAHGDLGNALADKGQLDEAIVY